MSLFRLPLFVCLGITLITPLTPALTGANRSEFPDAVLGDTQKLEFHASTPLIHGTLQIQTRAGLQELIRRSNGGTIIKLRVFAVGSDNLTTAQDTIRKTFDDRKLPLPALALLGVAGFPSTAQHVEIESTVSSTEVRNRDGLAFLAGLASPSGEKTIDGLLRVAHEGNIPAENILRISCFYESPEQVDSARQAIAKTFPSAEASFVFSYAAAAKPQMECEAVARNPGPPSEGIRYLNLPGERPNSNFSRLAILNSRRLVFTSGLNALGDSEDALENLLKRLSTAAGQFDAKLSNVLMAGNYWLSAPARDQLRTVRARYYAGTVPAATGVFFTSLVSNDATAALELIVPAPDAMTLGVGNSLMHGAQRYKSHLATMTQSVSKDGVTLRSRTFRMDKFVTEQKGVPVFRLLIDSVPSEKNPKYHSETLLNLQTMALIHRDDHTEGGPSVTFDVDGVHVTGHEQDKPIDFTNEVPSFYAPFLDAAMNAVDLHGGEIFRLPAFDLITRRTEWHTYRVAARETVRVNKRKVEAWVVEEEGDSRYKLRRIWLTREPPFFPLDVTYFNDGSIRRVEQTLVSRRP